MITLTKAGGIIQSVSCQNKKKSKEEGNSLYLNWDIHCLMPSDIYAGVFWVFGLRLELTLWALLYFQPANFQTS